MRVSIKLLLPLFFLGLFGACESMNSSRRSEAGGAYGLAREADNRKSTKRIAPEELLSAARQAGDSLTFAAARELREEGLPLDSFRIKRLPNTSNLATKLGATVAVIPVARASAEVRVSRPTVETFSYVRPAGPGKVWRAYFTRRAVADFYMSQHALAGKNGR